MISSDIELMEADLIQIGNYSIATLACSIFIEAEIDVVLLC